MTWVHWVLYNLPPGRVAGSGFAGCAAARHRARSQRLEEVGGPCPPIGRHRYVHKLYALDTVLDVLKPPTKSKLLEAMQGHVLAEAELVGTYKKTARRPS